MRTDTTDTSRTSTHEPLTCALCTSTSAAASDTSAERILYSDGSGYSICSDCIIQMFADDVRFLMRNPGKELPEDMREDILARLQLLDPRIGFDENLRIKLHELVIAVLVNFATTFAVLLDGECPAH